MGGGRERWEGYFKGREGGRDRGRLLQREGGREGEGREGGRERGRGEKEVITKRGREEWRVLQGYNRWVEGLR